MRSVRGNMGGGGGKEMGEEKNFANATMLQKMQCFGSGFFRRSGSDTDFRQIRTRTPEKKVRSGSGKKPRIRTTEKKSKSRR